MGINTATPLHPNRTWPAAIAATLIFTGLLGSLNASAAHIFVGQESKVTKKKSYHWPEATIPVVIPASLEQEERMISGRYTLAEEIRMAHKHWTDKTGGVLKFVEISEADAANYPNYLQYRLISSGQCNHTKESSTKSGVYGMEPPGNGVEYVSFNDTSCGPGALDYAIVLHEIGHAIGFHHESERTDRNDWVTLNDENIQLFSRGSATFKRLSKSKGSLYQYKQYDPTSIMHYGPYFLSKDYLYFQEKVFPNRIWDGNLDSPVFSLNEQKFKSVMTDSEYNQMQRRWYENFLFGTAEVLTEERKNILLQQLPNIPLYADNPQYIGELEDIYNGGTPYLPSISDLDAEAAVFHYTGTDLRVKIAADHTPSRDKETGFVDYRLHISNRGAWPASDVTVTHQYRPTSNFQFEGYLVDGVLVKSDADSGTPCTNNTSEGLLTCRYENLPPNAERVIHLRISALKKDSETFFAQIEPGFSVAMERPLAGNQMGSVATKSMHNDTGGDLNPDNNLAETKMGGSFNLLGILMLAAFRLRRRLTQ